MIFVRKECCLLLATSAIFLSILAGGFLSTSTTKNCGSAAPSVWRTTNDRSIMHAKWRKRSKKTTKRTISELKKKKKKDGRGKTDFFFFSKRGKQSIHFFGAIDVWWLILFLEPYKKEEKYQSIIFFFQSIILKKSREKKFLTSLDNPFVRALYVLQFQVF
jgi:hypothetical protein